MSAEPIPPPEQELARPRLAPPREEFHTHSVPVILVSPPEVPREALDVIARLASVPWVWKAMLEDLLESHARKAHFRLRLDLFGSYGSVKDADVTLKRKGRKPRS